MMSILRVVVLVSQDVSDIYFANQLMKTLNVVGVFVEKQWESPGFFTKAAKALKLAINPQKLLKYISDYYVVKHYTKKSKKIDWEHFGEEGCKLFPNEGCNVIYTEGKNAICKEVYAEKIKSLKPDVIVVCGTSILKSNVISIPQKGVLNLHGGLSQKYRGVNTTLWAIYNKEPEYVGFTVHYINEGIDLGNIIYQGRPNITPDDNPETLYVKVVKLGIETMLKTISDIQNNTVKNYPLKEKGGIYLGKMLTSDVIKKAWKEIDNGVITKYLENKAELDKKVIKIMEDAKVA